MGGNCNAFRVQEAEHEWVDLFVCHCIDCSNTTVATLTKRVQSACFVKSLDRNANPNPRYRTPAGRRSPKSLGAQMRVDSSAFIRVIQTLLPNFGSTSRATIKRDVDLQCDCCLADRRDVAMGVVAHVMSHKG